MAEIVNLRQARKRKAQADRDHKAAANRIKFGRKKADKSLHAAQTDLATKKLDAHHLEKQEPPPGEAE